MNRNDTSKDIAVGLLVDPGLAAKLADRLHGSLPERLRAAVDDTVRWTVDTVQDPFEAMYPDIGLLMEKACAHVRGTVWDLVICVTDQPMLNGRDVVAASLHTAERVAVISLPALGGLHHHRLHTVVMAAVACLLTEDGTRETGLRRNLPMPTYSVFRSDAHLDVILRRRWALFQAVVGMVRVNRPWRLFRGLSMALAGALAGMTFGILYSTIWTLASALGTVRLIAVTGVGVAVLAVWIIAGHELWESGKRDPEIRLRNISTVATVAVGAVAFFATLFLIALAAVALVVPPAYLAGVLGHPVGFPDYLTIALMASVLGTLAGAVGSGLENDTAVREATYGYRARQRRDRVERDAESGTTPTQRYRRD
ncbi:hypothetical protein ALI144C_24985 [Actinosynnema sp. ALI-1.44]|uniref:hypothetical protein n=1 Tax=Actinosynnema sp. ALI-1.44 TaxID=1933779 RepID=UPI00097C27F5|nr:hypothetical protein [Actinosynnema sp. ALI-1.44]ONI79972.1 hypothetical protein ALI144C_24985 [Actinosynnema sp. ALI-1.44]